jgi:hypothetical protein
MWEALVIFLVVAGMGWMFMCMALLLGMRRRVLFRFVLISSGLLFLISFCVPGLDLLPHGGTPVWWFTGALFAAALLDCLIIRWHMSRAQRSRNGAA